MSIINQTLVKLWAQLKLTKKSDMIFILGHMRSGSSLLEHILSTNNEILGVGEQGRVYNNEIDLLKMELFIRKHQRKWFFSKKYFVDQILHNKLTPNFDLLKKTNFKFVFLIRSPESSISSIENLKGSYYSIKNKGDFNSINYYIERLETLTLISKNVAPDKQILITYDGLITNTQETLLNLSEFLQLKNSLKKEYKVTSLTGELGDRSENIKKGLIIQTKPNLIQLNAKTKIKLFNSYNKTLEHFG